MRASNQLELMESDDRIMPGPLFDTPTERVLRSLPTAVAPVFEKLLVKERVPAQHLRYRISEYLSELADAQQRHEFLDVQLARTLADQCLLLLDTVDVDTPSETRRLIQAAVLYFLRSEDAESDKESLLGFDDDAVVIELVAREIGREDVLG